MLKCVTRTLVLGWWAATGMAWAQSSTNLVSTNTFQVSILPPAGTVMVTQTVQAVFVTVQNSNLWTNVVVTMQSGGQTVPLFDDGVPPDVVAGDFTFSGSLVVPALSSPGPFEVTFTVSGQDLSVTNDMGELQPGAAVTNTASVTYLAAGRPANDDFANALRVPAAGGVFLGTNTFASIEPDEPFHGGDPSVAASLWWVWSPAVSGNVLVDTAGSSFSPVVAVYTGDTLDSLSLVAWSTNDVQNGLKAHVNFDAVAGVTYRIAVAGYDTNGVGTIRLTIAPGGEPDTIPPQVTILAPTNNAVTGSAVLAVSGAAKDAAPNDTGVSQVLVQVNAGPLRPATGTTNWSATVTLTNGLNVIGVVAQDVAGNLSQPAVVQVSLLDPFNDNFVNALLLTNVTGSATGDNVHATKEPGEPFIGGNDGGHSVWFLFTAPSVGLLHLSTQGSGFDTLLGLYTGASVSNLTTIAEAQSAPGGYCDLTTNLQAGVTYAIGVDGFGGATGLYQLHYTFTSTATYFTLTVPAALGGIVIPRSGLYLAGSTQYLAALPERGFAFAGWQGAGVGGGNPLALVITQDSTLSASFEVIAPIPAFDTGRFETNLNLTWSFGGDQPWLLQTNVVDTGRFAARSGHIGDSQQSSLILDTGLATGTGAFRVRVSSEANWDVLEFYLNGVLLQRWSGDVPWQTFTFPVPAGANHLEWRYVKDANFSAGLDAAFIDGLYLPLPTIPLAANLTLLGFPDGERLLWLQGYPNRTYAIQGARGFTNWTDMFTTNVGDTGAIYWWDTPSTNRPVWFYRGLLR